MGGSRGVNLLNPLPLELPRMALPSVPAPQEIGHLAPLALVVAMACSMQTSAGKHLSFREERADDVSRDFAGVGAGSFTDSRNGQPAAARSRKRFSGQRIDSSTFSR
jgi:hypothetical protein